MLRISIRGSDQHIQYNGCYGASIHDSIGSRANRSSMMRSIERPICEGHYTRYIRENNDSRFLLMIKDARGNTQILSAKSDFERAVSAAHARKNSIKVAANQ
jgi:hypothetical protein